MALSFDKLQTAPRVTAITFQRNARQTSTATNNKLGIKTTSPPVMKSCHMSWSRGVRNKFGASRLKCAATDRLVFRRQKIGGCRHCGKYNHDYALTSWFAKGTTLRSKSKIAPPLMKAYSALRVLLRGRILKA